MDIAVVILIVLIVVFVSVPLAGYFGFYKGGGGYTPSGPNDLYALEKHTASIRQDFADWMKSRLG